MRCGKSNRLRWINYLRSDLNGGALTEAEENGIIHLRSRLGNMSQQSTAFSSADSISLVPFPHDQTTPQESGFLAVYELKWVKNNEVYYHVKSTDCLLTQTTVGSLTG